MHIVSKISFLEFITWNWAAEKKSRQKKKTEYSCPYTIRANLETRRNPRDHEYGIQLSFATSNTEPRQIAFHQNLKLEKHWPEISRIWYILEMSPPPDKTNDLGRPTQATVTAAC